MGRRSFGEFVAFEPIATSGTPRLARGRPAPRQLAAPVAPPHPLRGWLVLDGSAFVRGIRRVRNDCYFWDAAPCSGASRPPATGCASCAPSSASRMASAGWVGVRSGNSSRSNRLLLLARRALLAGVPPPGNWLRQLRPLIRFADG